MTVRVEGLPEAEAEAPTWPAERWHAARGVLRHLLSSRFYRWCQSGLWDRILSALQAEADARGEIDWDLHFCASRTLIGAAQRP